jgi:hypothetical protein
VFEIDGGSGARASFPLSFCSLAEVVPRAGKERSAERIELSDLGLGGREGSEGKIKGMSRGHS